MLCNRDMHHFAAGVMDHEEDIESPKEDGLDTEEVTGPDIHSVPLEEGPPTRRRHAVIGAAHVFGDGARRDIEAQPGQLRLDPALTPQRIL